VPWVGIAPVNLGFGALYGGDALSRLVSPSPLVRAGDVEDGCGASICGLTAVIRS
jgi:hypothetical protein